MNLAFMGAAPAPLVVAAASVLAMAGERSCHCQQPVLRRKLRAGLDLTGPTGVVYC